MRYTNAGTGLHRFVDPADGNPTCTRNRSSTTRRWFACFDQPDLKAPYHAARHRRPAWMVAAQRRGDPVARRALGVRRRPPPLATYFVTRDRRALPRRCTTSTTASRWRSTPGRRSATHLDAQAAEIFEITTAVPRPLPPAVRRAVSVRQVRPGVRARSSRLGAMENPGCVTFRDDYIFTSAATEAEREDAGAASSPTRWPTCGSATWSPCAGGTTSGSTSRSPTTWLPRHRRGHRVSPPRGRRSRSAARPGATRPTSGRPPTRSRATSPTPTGAAQLRRDLLRQGRLGAASSSRR